MAIEIEISFSFSTSLAYPEAVEMARAFPSYSTSGADKLVRHKVRETVTEDLWPRLNDLLIYISSWKRKEVRINGSTDRVYFQVAELRSIFECRNRRADATDGDRYCNGQDAPASDPRFFGCRFARGARLISHPGYHVSAPPPDWWLFGYLDEYNQNFAIDKPALLDEVTKASSAAPCSACPSFSVDRVKAVVKALPDAIEVGWNWAVRYSDVDPNQAIGLRPKEEDER